MEATQITPEDRVLDVFQGEVHYLKAGSGAPLVVLHQDIGNPGWLPFYDLLAQKYTVYVPDLPGWGKSARRDWMKSVRDLAVGMQIMLDKLDLANVTLAGLGFGGYVAAEMVTMDQRRFKELVLIGAAGIQPREGEIMDQFLLAYDEYVRQGFADMDAYNAIFGELESDTLMTWDVHREMVARVAWKPFMFSQTLDKILEDVRTRTLIIWGGEDRVIPVECGELYRASIPDAWLDIIPGAGHFVEMERPKEVADLIFKWAS